MAFHYLNVINPIGDNISYDDGQSLKVRLVASEFSPIGDAPRIQRSSPVFPLTEKEFASNPFCGEWHIIFLSPKEPFVLLGSLTSGAYVVNPDEVWYGIGSSCVMVMTQRDLFDDLVSELSMDRFEGWERWRIRDGSLVKAAFQYPEMAESATVFSDIPDYSHLPRETSSVIDEFVTSYECVFNQARRYNQDEVERLRSLLDHVVESISELIYLQNGEGDLPPGLHMFSAGELVRSPILKTQLSQQRRDKIVQINSSLSYVASQCISGAAPILQNPSIVRRHRLLGVGAAWRALSRIVSDIESHLYEFPVTDVIRSKWPDMPRLPGVSGVAISDTSDWTAVCGVDKLLKDAGESTVVSKLVHFSGRNGFRESEFSVSAAIQAIATGDTAEWHIATITHEILHGYVRAIIAAIFRVSPEHYYAGGEIIEFTSIYNKFEKHMFGQEGNDFYLLDSVRSIILSYCCMVPACGSLSTLPMGGNGKQNAVAREIGDIKIPSEADLKIVLQEELRNISEIMVHVLDFLYFFNGHRETYTKFVWLSWAVVPIVIADVRQYVLRTLLVLASVTDGTIHQRFREAALLAIDILTEAEGYVGETAVLREAVTLLQQSLEQDVEPVDSLVRPFAASLRIVDLTAKVIKSSKLKSRMYTDEVELDPTGIVYRYEFGEGEFRDRAINSRAEFVGWRVQAAVEGDRHGIDVEKRTAWMYLACAN